MPNPRGVNSLDELRALTGQEAGASDWLTVTQEMINRFADVTDHHRSRLSDCLAASAVDARSGRGARQFQDEGQLRLQPAAICLASAGGRANPCPVDASESGRERSDLVSHRGCGRVGKTCCGSGVAGPLLLGSADRYAAKFRAHPFGQRLCGARFRTNVLVPVTIGQRVIPLQQDKLFTFLRMQPPMVCFALGIHTVVAFIRAADLHRFYSPTSIRLPRSRKCYSKCY